MKAVVILLALLVAAKLGYHEFLFRVGTRDAIVGAYKEHAAQACQNDARNLGLALAPHAWSNPVAIKLVIGKGSFDVYPWQVDHGMWRARYRNPYLHLTAGGGATRIACEYDIVNAAASVSRL